METHSEGLGESGDHWAPYPTQQASERWEIDPSRSVLTFALRQLLVQRVSGHFVSWGGTLFLARRQPSFSSVRMWVDLDSIDTGSTERDIHLCSAEFLDVARRPRATFQSTSVKIDVDKVLVSGSLDLHGVSRDVALSITPMAMPESATIGQRETFLMTATINRQDFNLRWNDRDIQFVEAVVSDQVNLIARVEVVRMVDDSGAGTR